MFGSWASIMSAPPQDPNAERPPPPPATPLSFPAYAPAGPPQQPKAENIEAFFKSLHRAARPESVKGDALAPINLKVEYDVPLETLIPSATDGQNFVPPLESTADVDTTPGQMSNGLPYPSLKKYHDKRAELLHPNDTCYATVKRVPGAERVRLAAYHQFYLTLDDMSTYWDTSKDNYFEVEDKERKGIMRRAYTGLRVGTGRNMPEAVRERCVRTFIEVVSWDFGLRVVLNSTKSPAAPPPRLKIGNAVFMAPRCPTHYIYRAPLAVAQQKAGFLEGPVLATHFRTETFFRHKSEPEGRGKGEITDALRDAFCVLVTAQCRAREGRKEVIKRGWWTDRPKWGGGPPPEPAERFSGSGNSEAKEEKRLKRARVSMAPQRVDKDRTNAEGSAEAGSERKSVSILPPVKGSWDPKVTYLAIGKEAGQKDNIFVINSANHHISFSRYSLSDSYLAFLEIGALPEASNQVEGVGKTEDDADWHVLDMKRGIWYDLLIPEDRAEALRVLWGILSYLMRTTMSKGNTEEDEMKS